MMIFSFTAVQATDELPKDSEEQTIVHGNCPRCPRHNHKNSDEETAFFAALEDDNDEFERELGSFSVTAEDENNPNSSKGATACCRKKRKFRHSSSDELACCGKKRQKPQVSTSALVCNENEKDEVITLPATA